MKIILIKATQTDVDDLMQLRMQTMASYLEQAGLVLSEQDHLFRLKDDFDCCYLIMMAGERVGMVKYKGDERKIELMQLQISPDHQGQGIGRLILKHLFEMAKVGSQNLFLTVLKDNPAIRLYQRFGFNTVGEDEFELHMEMVV